MAELLPPGLDGVRGLSLGADNFADYTLCMEELVAQSSSLFECDVDVNPPAIPLEAHGSRFCAGVIASESLNAFQLQEKEEKLHLLQKALEEVALHFANYDGTAYPKPFKQNRIKKYSAKFNQPLMDGKLRLRCKVFGARLLHKCNLCHSEFSKRLELLLHKMKRHQKPKLPHLKLNKGVQPSCGKEIQASLKRSNDYYKMPKSSTTITRKQLEYGQSKNLSSSRISKEWLCCHHCDYKSHRYDFFNIHLERAHKKEEDELPREKDRRLDSHNSSQLTNTCKGKSAIDIKARNSIAKSENRRLTVPFECETCHKHFVNRSGLNLHVMRHGTSNWEKCSHCDYCAQTNHSMKLHQQNMHPDKAVKYKPQSQMEKLASKKQSHNDIREGFVKCIVCEKEIIEKKIQRHMLLHDPTKLVSCPFCPYMSYQDYNVKMHISNIHSDKLSPNISKSNNLLAGKASSALNLGPSNSTSSQGSRVAGSVKTNKQSKRDEKMAHCSVCRKDVPKSLMSVHLTSHDKRKWLRCKHCDYVSRRKDYMKLHVDTIHSIVVGRTESKPIKDGYKECPICRNVIHGKRLRTHLDAHDPSKWKRCAQCEYTSADPSQFKRHLALHAEGSEKAIVPSASNECPYCDLSIRCISKIYSHIQSEHPELSGPESVQQKESFEESDGLHESFEIFSESNDSDTDGERIKVDFSAIRKILSSIFPSSRGN